MREEVVLSETWLSYQLLLREVYITASYESDKTVKKDKKIKNFPVNIFWLVFWLVFALVFFSQYFFHQFFICPEFFDF